MTLVDAVLFVFRSGRPVFVPCNSPTDQASTQASIQQIIRAAPFTNIRTMKYEHKTKFYVRIYLWDDLVFVMNSEGDLVSLKLDVKEKENAK